MSEEENTTKNEELETPELESVDSGEQAESESADVQEPSGAEEPVDLASELDGSEEASEGELDDCGDSGESTEDESSEEEALVGPDSDQLQRIIEGAILAAGEAVSIDKILSLFEHKEQPEKSEIKEALEAIQEKTKDRGFELVEVASGWRFQVVESVATWVNRLWEEKPQKYSKALLETLALIAYRQPITRGDIEDVRGVAVSSHIIKTLVERDWVKVVGHRDVPGRPALYATTRQFLDYFNLKSLDELPTLGELQDIEGLNENLGFEAAVDDAKAADASEGASEPSSDESSTPEESASSDENTPPAVEGESTLDETELNGGDESLEVALDSGEEVEAIDTASGLTEGAIGGEDELESSALGLSEETIEPETEEAVDDLPIEEIQNEEFQNEDLQNQERSESLDEADELEQSDQPTEEKLD